MREWILGLTGAAVLSAVGIALAPEGRVKKAVKLICGAAVLLSLLAGVTDLDMTAYSRSMAEYRMEAERMTREASEKKELLEKEYIEERCRAYILDKAAETGYELKEVTVGLEWSADGFWYPVEAKLVGEGDESTKKSLSKTIESELGIPVKRQIWSGTDGQG